MSQNRLVLDDINCLHLSAYIQIYQWVLTYYL